VNEIVAVPGSTSGVPKAAIDAWGCLVLIDGTAALVSAANGGHHDSSDNGVYSIDLSKDAPAWETKLPSSTVVQEDAAYYADGKPTSRHGYQHCHYISQRGRIMLFGARGNFGMGGSPENSPTYGLDVSAGVDGVWAWDPAGTWADLGGQFASRGFGIARDPNTGNVISSGNWLWTQATNTWSQPPGVDIGVRVNSQFDTKRQRFFGFQIGDGQGYGGTTITAGIVDRTTGARTAISWAADAETTASFAELQAKTPGIGNTPAYETMAYDAANDVFWLYYGDAVNVGEAQKFYRITPQDAANGWAMSRATFAGVQLPVTAFAGINGRVRYIPELHGFAIMPSATAGIFFVRTS
jgi:hypothetical protein